MMQRPPRSSMCPYTSFFCFNDTATTEIYTLSLHDALPISGDAQGLAVDEAGLLGGQEHEGGRQLRGLGRAPHRGGAAELGDRSEEHTSELQSRQYLVCRLLLEKKKKATTVYILQSNSSSQL